MANLSQMSTRLGRYISSAEDKVGQGKSAIKKLDNDWQGEAHKACKNTSWRLYKELQEIDTGFRRLKSKVDSLENSIEAAKRDMKMKRATRK